VELCCFADWQSAGLGESKPSSMVARAEYHSATQQITNLRFRDLPLDCDRGAGIKSAAQGSLPHF